MLERGGLSDAEGDRGRGPQRSEGVAPGIAQLERLAGAAGAAGGSVAAPTALSAQCAGGVERRNDWQLVEAMGEAAPDGVQRLLTTARWDTDGLRDDLRSYTVEHVGDPAGVGPVCTTLATWRASPARAG